MARITSLKLNPDNELSEEHLLHRVAEEMSPCKVTIDPKYFVRFGIGNNKPKYCYVFKNKRAKYIAFNAGMTKEFRDKGITRIILGANKSGTIILIEPATENGVRLSIRSKRSWSDMICAEAVNYLESVGIKLPAKYQIEWDEQLKVWVGRLLKDGEGAVNKRNGVSDSGKTTVSNER